MEEPLPKEQNITADDIKFMRSAMEKSYRQFKPETHVVIMWGLVCMTAYISIHFLIKQSLQDWIPIVYLSLIGFGAVYNLITALVFAVRQKKGGFIAHLPWQLGAIAITVMLPIIFWDQVGLFKNMFCQAGFMYAMGFAMVMGIIGILYSKEWLLSEVLIIAGMLLAFFAQDSCPLVILGLSMGGGLIITAIIADINYRRRAKENEQA